MGSELSFSAATRVERNLSNSWRAKDWSRKGVFSTSSTMMVARRTLVASTALEKAFCPGLGCWIAPGSPWTSSKSATGRSLPFSSTVKSCCVSPCRCLPSFDETTTGTRTISLWLLKVAPVGAAGVGCCAKVESARKIVRKSGPGSEERRWGIGHLRSQIIRQKRGLGASERRARESDEGDATAILLHRGGQRVIQTRCCRIANEVDVITSAS